MGNTYAPTTPLSMPFSCVAYDNHSALFPVKDHTHYFTEILLVKKGNLIVQRGNEQFTLGPGELLFITPLIHHAISCPDGQNVFYQVIKLDPEQMKETPSYAPSCTSIVLEAEQHHLPMHLTAEEVRNNHIDSMIDQCVKEYQELSYGYDQMIRSLLYLVLNVIIRLWIRKGFSPRPEPVLTEPIYSITSYIDSHIGEALKVEDLASHCGLSYPWFAKRFREIYGISCKEYIKKVRISKVEHYLLFTDCDLGYISRETGYADCSHMIKDFRQLRNTTPGRFRQARQG